MDPSRVAGNNNIGNNWYAQHGAGSGGGGRGGPMATQRVIGCHTVSSVHCVVFAFSLVQYRTCSVPLDRPGKNSAICFQVRLLFSLRSTSSVSSSGVNLSFGARGRGAGDGICCEDPGIPIPPLEPPGLPPPPIEVRGIFEGGGWSDMWWRRFCWWWRRCCAGGGRWW